MKDLVKEPEEMKEYFLVKRTTRAAIPTEGKPVMKAYSNYLGSWVPREYVLNPSTRERIYTLWEFEPKSTRPRRTNMRMPEGDMEFYNYTRRQLVTNVQCDQLMPDGEMIRIFYELDENENPFKGMMIPQKLEDNKR